MKPFINQVPSYLRDTTDFLNKIEGQPFDSNSQWLVSFDVTSLYTQIPEDEGLEAMEVYLETRVRPHRVPIVFVLDLARLALKRNYFRFENTFYMQVKGSAMGCPFAPEMAILFMALLEERSIDNNNPFSDCITQWYRYIDDIWCVWSGSENQLSQFYEWLNTRHPDIKFTMTKSRSTLTFLDVEVFEENQRLTTTLHRKSTDRNTILHYQSSHPNNLKNNLPYGQLLRIRRNCARKEDFMAHALMFCDQLRDRGYPRKLLKHAVKRAWYTPRETLLTKRVKPPMEKLVCVSTFGPHTNKYKKIITSNWHLLSQLECPIGKPLFAMRKNKSIGQKII